MGHPLSSVAAGALGMLVAGGFLPADAEGFQADESLPASIVVRTYIPADPNVDIRAAHRTAGAILERAGIRVVWFDCALSGAADACQAPLGSNELVLRIVREAADSSPHADTLGFAFVDLHAGGGSLATVYADRVTLMARRAGVNEAELMGRAIAHEIGHLLLGTNQHARHGLMRGSWSASDLRRDLALGWLFDGREGEMMRRGIARRLAAW